jgi:3-vinyl bacteriochlorophyllide hydratase
MLVLALHTAYVLALFGGWLGSRSLMLLALAAYLAYLINATQFLIKLRSARREQPRLPKPFGLPAGAAE